MTEPHATPLIEDRFNRRFFAFFAGYASSLICRSFCAARLDRDSIPVAKRMARHSGPVIVAMSHASWWDPLLGIVLHRRFMPGRIGLAPMDASQLARFRFFTKLGLFGINPDDPASLRAMRDHVRRRFTEFPDAALWITPQGRFADPREDVVVRPGAATIIAENAGALAISLAVEYPFWQDKRPEVLMRFEPIDNSTCSGSTAGALREVRGAMQRNREALARLAIARDAGAFDVLLGRGEGRINPAYDLWLRVRGRDGAIEVRRNVSQATAPGSATIPESAHAQGSAR